MSRQSPPWRHGVCLIAAVTGASGCFDLGYSVGDDGSGGATSGAATTGATSLAAGGSSSQGSSGGEEPSSSVASASSSAAGTTTGSTSSSSSSTSSSSASSSSASSSSATSSSDASTSSGTGGEGGAGTGGTGGDGGGGVPCNDTSVVLRSPLANEVDVEALPTIAVSFACPVDAATVRDDTFLVTGSVSGPVGGALSLTEPAEISFTPDKNFLAGEQVTVEVTSAVMTVDGAPADTTYSFFVATDVLGGSRLADTHQQLGGEASSAIALGYLDGDDFVDAYAANPGADRVWFGDGTGTFTAGVQSLGSTPSSGVALGDLDGDGDLDAYVLGASGPDAVWRNEGSRVFTDTAQALGSGSSTAVVLGDLDGDGALDALVTSGTGLSRVWFNDGSGVFTAMGVALGMSGDAPTGVALADLDRDGDLDAVISDSVGFGARVYRNDGDGSFAADQVLAGGIGAQGVAIADVDGNGDLDVVVATAASILVWSGNDAGAFEFLGSFAVTGGAGGIALGDLDGDGALDVLTRLGATALNQGDGSFVDAGIDLGTSRAALGDLDGDGDLDVFASSTGTDRVYLTVPAATSCAAIHAEAPAIGSGPQRLGDGAPDELFQAYCDMTTNGGGWTLLFNQGPSFDRSTFGDRSADCHDTTCVSLAYSAVPLGDDMMFDVADVAITGASYDVRTVMNGIEDGLSGASLRERLTAGIPYYVEPDDNQGVFNTFSPGLGCEASPPDSLPYDDWRTVICSTRVLRLHDTFTSVGAFVSLGMEDSRSTLFFNGAGWPQNPSIFWPDYFRIWTR